MPEPLPKPPASSATTLQGKRVRLRPWLPEDRAPFAALNADAEVMRHFPATLTGVQSDALAERIQSLIDNQGWGFWAAEAQLPGKARAEFIGFVGLHRPSADLPFAPCVEIGWRLKRQAWGQGLASEAAQLALRFGFEHLLLPEIVAFTAVGNQRSRAVMQRLGMQRQPADDFEHPAVATGHALRAHCLYRLPKPLWQAHQTIRA